MVLISLLACIACRVQWINLALFCGSHNKTVRRLGMEMSAHLDIPRPTQRMAHGSTSLKSEYSSSPSANTIHFGLCASCYVDRVCLLVPRGSSSLIYGACVMFASINNIILLYYRLYSSNIFAILIYS